MLSCLAFLLYGRAKKSILNKIPYFTPLVEILFCSLWVDTETHELSCCGFYGHSQKETPLSVEVQLSGPNTRSLLGSLGPFFNSISKHFVLLLRAVISYEPTEGSGI